MRGTPLIAGVELGGTKSVATLARGSTIIAQKHVGTTTPGDTLGALREELVRWHGQEPFAALGVATFGPVQLDRDLPRFGHLLATPKPGWSGTDIGGALSSTFTGPWSIDTDVNAAALAEWTWGAAAGLSSVCYLTIGTGVGGGFAFAGRPHHGALHPEIGHLPLRRAPGDLFAGVCPFHSDCIEGLISGPALRSRFGCDPNKVDNADVRWSFVAHDLAELLAAIVLVVSPQKILVGGGVGLGRSELLRRARVLLKDKLSAYLPRYFESDLTELVAHPALGSNSGPLGAIALGETALAQIAGKGFQHA